MSIAPPHALLVAHWGSEGAAVLSLPTKEYFQSSGWVEEKPPAPPTAFPAHRRTNGGVSNDTTMTSVDIRSVRSGSDFWAGARSRTPSSSAFTANYLSDVLSSNRLSSPDASSYPALSRGNSTRYNTEDDGAADDDDNESQQTEAPPRERVPTDDGVVDEVGAQDAFVAGMIFALSRRIVPGAPYTPSSHGEPVSGRDAKELERGRWRLDECLRYARSWLSTRGIFGSDAVRQICY